ncbi:hypothetical protein [Halococcus sp. PRR34]|uniref:hypothetical protein n=1 Tax=Halococcus sp. PRR34 TaxID=3020830 RepID=UPI0023619B74|nr:hypothetical protein [Halococcus sp. PRR34]
MLELLAMVFAKEADRAEVRVLIRGEIAESDVTFEVAVEFAGASDADTVAKDEDFEHHDGMEGRPATAVRLLIWIERVEAAFVIEMIDDVGDVGFEAVVFDPIRDVLREEVLLILIVSNKVRRHG